MRLTSVRIGNYRSAQDVDLELRSLTALVGPNNAGKSNIVDALDFLRGALESSIDSAVKVKGGFQSLLHRGDGRAKRSIEIGVTALIPWSKAIEVEAESRRRVGLRPHENDDPEFDVQVDYDLAVSQSSRSGLSELSVRAERLRFTFVSGDDRFQFVDLVRDGNEVQIDAAEGIPSLGEMLTEMVSSPLSAGNRLAASITAVLRPDRLVFDYILKNEILFLFNRFITQMSLRRLDPERGRDEGFASSIPELDLRGGNLPPVAYRLQTQAPEAWHRVLEFMRLAVPDLDRIEAKVSLDDRIILQFFERGVKRPWTARQMSDGTLRMLGLLVSAFDPMHRLVVLEEPENNIHPWMVRSFVEACKIAVCEHGKQILITSHSGILIDLLTPDDILIVWRESGRTRAAPLHQLDGDLVAAWSDGDATLFQILDSGLVREAVPGGLG